MDTTKPPTDHPQNDHTLTNIFIIGGVLLVISLSLIATQTGVIAFGASAEETEVSVPDISEPEPQVPQIPLPDEPLPEQPDPGPSSPVDPLPQTHT